MTLYLNLKTDVNEPTESNEQIKLEKNFSFVGILKVTNKKSRIRIQIRIHNQVYGSKDPDLDHSGSVPKCHGSGTLLLLLHMRKYGSGATKSYMTKSFFLFS
jgi:hypothetical protein